MLDARVRETLQDFQSGRCDLETAAQRLLVVRRERGCLTLMDASGASPEQRALVSRFRELTQAEFGDG